MRDTMQQAKELLSPSVTNDLRFTVDDSVKGEWLQDRKVIGLLRPETKILNSLAQGCT